MSTLQASLPAQTAGGGDSTTILGVVTAHDGQGLGASALYLTSPTAVTGAATNNYTASFRQVRAGSVVQTIGSVTFASGTNLAVEVPLSVAISTPTAFQVGDVVDVLLHQNGTGLASPVGIVASCAVN